MLKYMRKFVFLSVLLSLLLVAATSNATIQWANNATSVIADVGGISAGSTSLTVTAGHGDRFPVIESPHYFMATLVDTSGNREIVKVTARALSSNTMTIVRAQEGTTARAFAAGSLVELRITKNALDYLSKSADISENHYVADASAVDQGDTANARSLKSLVDDIATQQATIEVPHTGTGATTTYTVGTDLTIPATITLRVHKGALISVSAGKTLTVSGVVQAGAYQIFTGTGTATVTLYPQDQAWWGSAQRLDGNVNLILGSDADGDMYVRSGGVTVRVAKGTANQVWQMNSGATAAEWGNGTLITPTGAVMPYAGSTAPSGWLLCYGQAVSRTTYAVLYAVIGTTYGVGDGSTTFNVPDLRGRAAIGLDNMGGSAASRVAAATSLGGAAGAETVNLAHTHTTGDHTLTVTEIPPHEHTLNSQNTITGGGTTPADNDGSLGAPHTLTTSSVGGGTAHNHGATGSGGSATQAIMNPYMGLNYIVKY